MTFSIVKMPAKEVTIFREKSKLVIFHLKYTKAKRNCIVCTCITGAINSTDLLDYQVYGVWIASLAHAKDILKEFY